MKDDIHNTVVVDSSKDRATLLSLGDIQKALSQNKKGVKVGVGLGEFDNIISLNV